MFQTILHGIGTALIHWAALVGVASVVVHSRVAWRDTVMGRHLMAYMAAVAAVLVLSCVVNDVGDSAWFQAVRLVTFVAVPAVMTQRLWLQIKLRVDAQPAPLSDEQES
jgi:N-acetylglutamate synthase-like GNAT family acetyltransferase